MALYDGLVGDKIVHGGAYIDKHGFGGEVYNFRDSDNKYYGYVMKRNGVLNLSRINLNPDFVGDVIKNVTCVFVATHPMGGRCIVGWYHNATVYSAYQEYYENDRKIKTRVQDWDYDDQVGYFVTAHKRNVTLLTEDERLNAPQVPSGKNGFGQSNVWYADSDNGIKFRQKTMEFIIYFNKNKSHEIVKEHERVMQSKIDIKIKKKVEVTAIERIKEYYEELGYKCWPVEKENLGWDLEFTKGNVKLLVEVKGLSQSYISVLLSHNEYKKMRNNTKNYRLAVVTNCLDQERKPTINIFTYIPEKISWFDQYGHELKIGEIVEAHCELK